MTTQSADSSGVRIAYEELGGSGGDPVLLVMGLGTSRFWWPDGLVGEFVRRGFHVAAYDQRDAGESAHFPDERVGSPLKTLLRRTTPAYAAEDLANDAAVVLDALGWRRAHVFGHSLGGLVAQRIAIRHPDRILSLTTSSAVPSDVKGIRVLRYVQLGTVRGFTKLRFPETHQGNIDLAIAVVRLLAAPGQAIEESDVKACIEKEAEHNVVSFRDDKAQSRQIGAKWSGGRLSQITAPTLVLHGEDDPLLRVRAAQDVAAAIPGSKLRTFPGVGHFFPRESWPAYAAAVRELADRGAQLEQWLAQPRSAHVSSLRPEVARCSAPGDIRWSRASVTLRVSLNAECLSGSKCLMNPTSTFTRAGRSWPMHGGRHAEDCKRGRSQRCPAGSRSRSVACRHGSEGHAVQGGRGRAERERPGYELQAAKR
jgi:pimeloyl-ACP methyl ester carboxylesterase